MKSSWYRQKGQELTQAIAALKQSHRELEETTRMGKLKWDILDYMSNQREAALWLGGPVDGHLGGPDGLTPFVLKYEHNEHDFIAGTDPAGDTPSKVTVVRVPEDGNFDIQKPSWY